MSRLVLLLEEYSMKVLLDGLLPRLFPQLLFLCVPHEGKQDLEKSIPRKLRAWKEPGVQFVVVRDNDGADCRKLKAKLVKLCKDGCRADALVRIACQELEAWYFGDPDSLAEAFEEPSLRAIGSKAPYRDPDMIQQPATALVELAPAFQKVSGARAMAPRLSAERNSSQSFRVFVEGIGKIAQGMKGKDH